MKPHILGITLIALLFASCSSVARQVKKDVHMIIHGHVEPGFELVKEAFVENFRKRKEIGAACSIYYQGEKVVDLWGGYRDVAATLPWEENTLVRVYSTTKGMSLVVLAKLHSENLLDYNEPVSSYWPEFGKNGKETITVEELVSHKSGLVLLDRSVMVSELENYSGLSPLLESSTPMWDPGTKSGYCAATIGLFEQQIVRRVDPQARTIGRYFASEIADPLSIEFYIGLPPSIERERVAELKMISPASGIFNLHKPPKGMVKQIINPRSLFNKAFTVIVNDTEDTFSELSYEEPSGGGIGDARSLAKVYGLLATGGEDLGLSSETMQFMTQYASPPTDSHRDEVMGVESKGSPAGYLKPYETFDFGSSAAFGFSGTGGSFAFADPEYGLGFAYVMNRMDFYGTNDPREMALREAMYESVRRLEEQ